MNPMQIADIREVRKETQRIKTIILDMDVSAIPGQFVMVWIPGVDEKPMSVSYTSGYLGITVLELGEFTQRLCDMKVGNKLGIRGPMGRGFKIYGDRLLLVGGGVGTAPLAPLAEEALADSKEVTAIVGSLTARELLFAERMSKAGARVLVSTDDGSAGRKGFTTDVMKELLEEESFDQCFTCGPEIMMEKVLSLTKDKGIRAQASLHRYFKCGIGICGHCVLDGTGLRVCKEGPTFRDKELERSHEFGSYWRNASGQKIYFKGK